MRKYLNYIIFGAIVLLVVGLAVNHSRHMRQLVDTMAGTSAPDRKAAADELIKAEQFMDSITGEPVPTRIKAAEALEVLGTPAAVKQLLAVLKDTDKPVRDRAVQALQKIGGKSPDHIKELVVGLKDGDANVRKGTIAAFTASPGGIGPIPGVIKAIVDYMKPEAGARGPGGDVLGSALFRTPEASKESVALLTEKMDEKDEGVRVGATEALGKVGNPIAIPRLIKAMHEDTSQVRRVAIGSIALIADVSGELALTEAISNPDDDNESRAQAAAGLGKIATPTAISVLLKALDDDDLKLRSAAVAALARAARPDRDADAKPTILATLTTALRDKSENVRLGAAQALQVIAAPQANTALIATLDDRTAPEELRAAATTALGFPNNQAAVAPLVQALNDESSAVNTAARDALAAIGPEAAPALLAATQKDPTVAYYAAQALARQGAPAIPALSQAAESAAPATQRWVAVALGEIGMAETRPALQKLAASSDTEVARIAKEQLEKLGTAQ